MNLIPTDWQEEAARQSNDGGSSQGFGYTARALLERRVTSNWFVGTAIDIQQAKITHPAISCSTYVIPPPDGRVTWIYRRSR